MLEPDLLQLIRKWKAEIEHQTPEIRQIQISHDDWLDLMAERLTRLGFLPPRLSGIEIVKSLYMPRGKAAIIGPNGMVLAVIDV